MCLCFVTGYGWNFESFCLYKLKSSYQKDFSEFLCFVRSLFVVFEPCVFLAEFVCCSSNLDPL